MVQTIVFDIGNVLMSFDLHGYLRRLLGDEAQAARVYAAIWGSGLWNELDRGGEPEALMARMIEAGGPDRDAVRLALERVGDCMAPRACAGPWLEALKGRGYRLLYLSNYSRYVMALRPDVLYFLPLMDGGVFSCDERLIKPDPAIYRVLCARYDLNPAQCVFLDDTQANVDAAGALGFHTLRVTGEEQARAALDGLLARLGGK